MCRDGRLYDVERWIAEGKPLQLSPEAIRKGTRPKTALQIALEGGQHSLAFLLLRSGYRLELERYAPLDIALEARRWDLVDLLVEWGADLRSADVYTVLNTYDVELYERLRALGYDLTARHEMAAVLGHGTSNRPLLGFAKRHRAEDSKIQQEPDIALGYHVRGGIQRGINLCLWVGADPHAPAPNPELGLSEEADPEDGEEHFIGWTGIEEAARHGHLAILKRLGPDPARDNFDDLYRFARYESIVTFLATIQPPKDLIAILASHLWWMGGRFHWGERRGTSTVEALLACGVRWEETSPEKLTGIRKSFLKVGDYELKTILSRLRRPEVCASETYQELIRTPRMQAQMLALGLVKKPVDQRERHSDQLARLSKRYDRAALYEQVWSQPVQKVAKSYGISDVRLGKVCRTLRVPVPPAGLLGTRAKRLQGEEAAPTEAELRGRSEAAEGAACGIPMV